MSVATRPSGHKKRFFRPCGGLVDHQRWRREANSQRDTWHLVAVALPCGCRLLTFCIKRDYGSLCEEEQADVKKMASDRIRLVLAREGADLDELAKAERNQLLEMMAIHLLNRDALGNTQAGAVAGAPIDDRHLQLLERQLELQESELEFRPAEAEEQRKWRRRQFELEKEKKSESVRQQSFAARVKFYFHGLKLSTVKMTDEPGDLPLFFYFITECV